MGARISGTPCTKWRQLPLGAGGVIQRMSIANDGTKLCASDISGAYICDNSNPEWSNLYLPSNFSAFSGGFNGPWDVAISQTNSSKLYIAHSDGYCYRSVDKGKSFTQLAFAQFSGFSGGNTDTNNSAYRTTQRHLAIDPANDDVVYFGSNTAAGLQVSYDGGKTVSTVSVVTSSTSGPGMSGICVDPSGGTTTVNGVTVTKNIFVGVWGVGIFTSTDGAQAWSQISDGTGGNPTHVWDADIIGNGAYAGTYICCDSPAFASASATIWKYSAGTWTQIKKGGTTALTFAWIVVDNNSSGRVVFITDAGWDGWATPDAGTTINGEWFGNFPAGHWSFSTGVDIPWIESLMAAQPIGSSYSDCCCARFDPSRIANGFSTYLYMGDGIGVRVASATTANFSGTISSFSQSSGIENLVVQEVIRPMTAAYPIIACEDRPIINSNPSAFPSTYYGTFGVQGAAWSIDASADGRMVAALINSNTTEESGYSEDGGKNWNIFATAPTSSFNNKGGNISVSADGSAILILPVNVPPFYTLNNGGLWTSTTAGSNPLPNDGGYLLASLTNKYAAARMICADRVSPKTFYVFDAGGAGAIYRSDDGGRTWTKVNSGSPYSIHTNSGQNCGWLDAQPFAAGNVWYSDYPGTKFSRSVDAGATWSAVSGFTYVGRFGFGAKAPTSNYATIFVYGTYNGVKGFWRSIDNGTTWKLINPDVSIPYSPQTVLGPMSLRGDMQEYGKVYLPTHGNGVLVGSLH